MKHILFILITICSLQYSFGQEIDKKTKNKIQVKYFTANDFYEKMEYAKVLTKISEIEELSNGKVSADVQNLKVKTYIALEEFINAQKELDILLEMDLSSSIIKEVSKYSVSIEDNIESEREEAKILEYYKEQERIAEAIEEKRRLEKEEEKRIALEKEKKLRDQFDSVGRWLVIDQKYKNSNDWIKITIAKKDGKYGLIDNRYTIREPFKYDSISKSKLSKYDFKIMKDNKWGLISFFDGQKEITPEYLRIIERFKNVYSFRKNIIGNYYIFSSADWAISEKFWSIEKFRTGIMTTKKDGEEIKYGMISKRGRMVEKCENYHINLVELSGVKAKLFYIVKHKEYGSSSVYNSDTHDKMFADDLRLDDFSLIQYSEPNEFGDGQLFLYYNKNRRWIVRYSSLYDAIKEPKFLDNKFPKEIKKRAKEEGWWNR